MDSGLSIGASTGVSASPVRTDIGIARPTPSATPVATELPATQTVEATGQSQSANTQDRPPAGYTPPLNDSSLVVQKLSFDDTTHILVYSDVDPTTGYVVAQFPDKLVLRQKAYVRQMLDKAQDQSIGANKLA